MNKELWREANELTDSKPSRPGCWQAQHLPVERCLRPPALPPAHLGAPPPRGSGSGAEGGISGIVHVSSLPPPLLSTFCSIIARLLSLPFRLIRCGAASGEGSGSPAAGSAPAATREKERPLPAGRSPADARTGRCALPSVPIQDRGEAGGVEA